MHVSFQPQASIQDTFHPWQVALTRMDQQVWKQELDAAQKKTEKGADTEKGGKGGKGKAKSKAKAKARGKAKAKAKKDKDQVKTEKAEKKKKEVGRTKKRPAKAEEGDEIPQEEAEPEVKAPRKPRKSKKQPAVVAAAEEDLRTPVRANPPKAPSPNSSKRRKAPAEVADGVTPGKERKKRGDGDTKTFARRYKPTTTWGACKWEALRSVFTSIISVKVNGPLCKLEAIGFLKRKRRYIKFKIPWVKFFLSSLRTSAFSFFPVRRNFGIMPLRNLMIRRLIFLPFPKRIGTRRQRQQPMTLLSTFY